MIASRRSGRPSSARTKYTNDAFKAAELSDSASDNSTDQPRTALGNPRIRQASSDEDFIDAEPEGREDSDEADEFLEDDEVKVDQFDEESEVLEDEKSLDRSNPAVKQRHSRKRRLDGNIEEETHSRGIWNPVEHVSKTMHLKLTFGVDERDLLAVMYGRDRWYRGSDFALPSRKSLDEVDVITNYGIGETFGLEPTTLELESTTGWDWYHDDLSEVQPRKRQRTERISEEEARGKYLPQPQKTAHIIVIGPISDQKVFHLPLHESLNFGEAWTGVTSLKKEEEAEPHDPPQADATDAPGGEGPANEKKKREGWILNIGGKIQCMGWAHHQDELTQFLAIAAPVTEQQKSELSFTENTESSPAFTPSGPYPAALQIWSFAASKTEGPTKSLDMLSKPKLRMVICTDWGDIKRIEWCPVGRKFRDEDDKDSLKNIGLLAGVWGDGTVRVLDIKLKISLDTPEFCKVQSALFTCKPPATISTSVTWLSPSDIAVGYANGFVGVWNITSYIQTESEPDPLPYVYIPVHGTYITNIASGYPQHPHLLATTSMDGLTRLTSVLDPQKDAVDTNRMRMGSIHICYSPITQSWFSNDDNDFIRSLAVRRFYATTTVTRTSSSVSALAASSFWHPSCLVGMTGGSVIAFNPLRRLIHTKETPWHLKWFTHEWAPGKEAGSANVSRFLDGHRPESVSLLRTMMGDRRIVNGVMSITIYDEENHITSLAWNSNKQFAGWASAGMGSGLVRVEDLAV